MPPANENAPPLAEGCLQKSCSTGRYPKARDLARQNMLVGRVHHTSSILASAGMPWGAALNGLLAGLSA